MGHAKECMMARQAWKKLKILNAKLNTADCMQEKEKLLIHCNNAGKKERARVHEQARIRTQQSQL